MIVMALSVVVLLVGALLYFAGAGKWTEFGRVMFGVGLLVALLSVVQHPALLLK